MNNDGQLLKKKQLESMKPVAFKSISPVIFKEKENSSVKPPQQKTITTGNLQGEANDTYEINKEAKLIIKEIRPSKASMDHTCVTNLPTGQAGVNAQTKIKKLNSLEKIQEQVALENRENGNNIKELNEEELYIAWGFYIEELRKNNNHSAVSNFKLAKLNIVDNNCIEIIS